MIHLGRLMEKNRSEGRRKIVPSSSPSSSSSFDMLPVDCISKIISLASRPKEAGIAAMVSKTFDLAAKSDTIWEKFLPADYESLIPPSRVFSSKKELYFSLCDDPILIEDGKKSFWLEKTSGKRCIMLSAMDFLSNLDGKDIPYRLEWIPSPEARFEIVALLSARHGFRIRSEMNHHLRDLSPETHYLVYIVFKKRDDDCNGLEHLAMEAFVEVDGREFSGRYILGFDDTDKYPPVLWSMVKPKAREDGWTEIELGGFYNQGGLDNNHEIEINASLGVKDRKLMFSLIFLGIEIRPTKFL